jgi:hypothetical protein
MLRSVAAFIIWLAPCASVVAHALQPGFLDIRALGEERYAIGWKVPQVAGTAMPISPVLPERCAQRAPPGLTFADEAFSARWTTRCEGGLEGRSIAVEGLEHTSTDVLVRYAPAQAPTLTLRLTPERTGATIPRAPGLGEVVKTYTVLGIEHILLGIDHVLFVLALVLLVGGGWKLVKTITAFTLAHSITLSAAALGYVALPGPPVEAVIALSIVYLAHELDGWWPFPSACCTVSASPAHSRSWGCRTPRSRQRFSPSTWAWRSASSSSSSRSSRCVAHCIGCCRTRSYQEALRG